MISHLENQAWRSEGGQVVVNPARYAHISKGVDGQNQRVFTDSIGTECGGESELE